MGNLTQQCKHQARHDLRTLLPRGRRQGNALRTLRRQLRIKASKERPARTKSNKYFSNGVCEKRRSGQGPPSAEHGWATTSAESRNSGKRPNLARAAHTSTACQLGCEPSACTNPPSLHTRPVRRSRRRAAMPKCRHTACVKARWSTRLGSPRTSIEAAPR